MANDQEPHRSPYTLVFIRRDGSVAFTIPGFASRGWAYASAVKRAIDIRADGNAGQIDRIEIRDCDDEVAEGYRDDPRLRIDQEVPDGQEKTA